MPCNGLTKEIATKLYFLLTKEEQNALNKFYLNEHPEEFMSDLELEDEVNRDMFYPDINITQEIIDNFPTISQLQHMLFGHKETWGN